MAKRFITTELFKDPWFMDLPNKYKLFWIYLITNCEYTGIWQVNYKVAQFYVGEHLEPSECERIMNDRIVKIENGRYWFLPKFIEFQYGHELKYTNSTVKNVIKQLVKQNLLIHLPNVSVSKAPSKELRSTLQGGKDKDKDKDKDNKMNIDLFNQFWDKYPRKENKKKAEVKFLTLKKDLFDKIMLSLSQKARSDQWTKDGGKFIPLPTTWLNGERWDDEVTTGRVVDI